MATLLQPKQINKLLAAPMYVAAFAYAAGTSANVTAALTAAAGSAGDGGVAVPVQAASATQEGFIVTGNNIVSVYSATGGRLTDAGGNEVYGRLTLAAGVYTLSLFSRIAGVETAFNAPAQNIDFEPNYLYTFEHLPSDAISGMDARYVANDPAGGGQSRQVLVAVTALNTLAALAEAPNTARPMSLIVNGQVISGVESPASFTVAGTAITWNAVNAGYNLATTDIVVFEYSL